MKSQSENTHPFTGEKVGCGNFIIYQLSEDESQYLSISFKIQDVELKSSQTYHVGKAEIVEVKQRKYTGPIGDLICNDIAAQRPELLEEEIATEGLVEIVIDETNLKKAKENQPYKVTVVAKKLNFKSSSIEYLNISDVMVGWLPG